MKLHGCLLALTAASALVAAQSPDTALQPVAEYWDYFPDWSPDGSTIAFTSTRANHPTRALFLVDVETGTVSPLTRNSKGQGDGFPRWSPDGSWIAFSSDREGNTDIHLVRPDGSDLRNLTKTPSHEGGSVDWSPDGSRLVFISSRDGGPDLYTMKADGSDVRRVIDLPGSVTEPSWSPDGSRIAFSWSQDGNWELHSVALDGSDLTRLTWHWAWDGNPAWSPDGKQILFWSDRDEFWFEIYAMNADGSEVRRITDSPDWDLDPTWSRDGRRLAWHARVGRYGIEISNAHGTRRRRLTSAEPSGFASLVRRAGADSAIAAFRAAKQQQPDARFFYSGEPWMLAGELLEKGDTAGAIRLGRFHVEVESGTPYYAYEGLGHTLRAAGQPAPPSFAEFFATIRTKGVAAARAVFDDSRRRFPGWSLFSEFRMNGLGYEYLGRGWVEEAIGLFEMNVVAYPDSPNAHDSLAEALWRAGKVESAIRLYQRVVKMDPHGPVGANASRMLARLRSP